MCTAAVQASALRLSPCTPTLPVPIWLYFFTRPLWLEFDKRYLTVWHTHACTHTHKNLVTQTGHTEMPSALKVNWKPFCFCLHFIPPVIHTDPPTPPPPPTTPSPPKAPGLACILALGIHVSRPIDLLSFFKVRSWNLTQWGIEGQNQPITYRVG